MNAQGLDPVPHDEDARLANKATLFTLLSLCCAITAMVAIPLTFQHTEETASRIASALPLIVGVWGGFMARGVRAELNALRDRSESPAAGEGRG